jgi:hypothetical protein
MSVYVLDGSKLLCTRFELEGALHSEGGFKAHIYSSRIREVFENYVVALKNCNRHDPFRAGIFDGGMEIETLIETSYVKLEDSNNFAEYATLLFLYYVRFQALPISNLQYWKKIEAIIREPVYNEYFRFSLAMELIRKQLLD